MIFNKTFIIYKILLLVTRIKLLVKNKLYSITFFCTLRPTQPLKLKSTHEKVKIL